MVVANASLPGSVQSRHMLISLATALVLSACVTQETKRDAINDINAEFKVQYEAALAKNGSRAVNASSECAFDATNAALVSLGMVIKQQSRGLGYIQAEAPAPLPLTRSEWERASAMDLPKAKEILRRHVGALAEAFHFEPEGLDTVITATVIQANGGAQISLTMRMREVAPPQPGFPRREYPPPTALQAGLDKIWGALDRELKARPCKP